MTKHKSRRIRAALFLAIAGTAIALLGSVVSHRMDTLYSVHADHASVYVVSEGDTLWSIAQKVDPADYTPSVYTWIQNRNGLKDEIIYPGEKLIVP